MSEVNENVQEATQETATSDADQEITIQEEKKGVGYYVKKTVKGLLIFFGGVATGIVGGKLFGGKDDNDSAEAEAPQDE